ncbi:hypothetical protein TNCV_1768511 [Trichonephila clavipes]|nr:hypothetical protein TNCV_1768511 [Trichonephila clavipes]
MLEKVIENCTSRLDYIRAKRGSHMPEIIFKISTLDEYILRWSENIPCKHTRSNRKLGTMKQRIKKQKHKHNQKVSSQQSLENPIYTDSQQSLENPIYTGSQQSLGNPLCTKHSLERGGPLVNVSDPQGNRVRLPV